MKIFRKHVRLTGYDYSTPGGYFITICTDYMRCLFGEIANGRMHLNGCGTIAEQCLLEIPRHFPAVELDTFQIMPNHIHVLLRINECGHKLGNIVGPYKAAVTKRIRLLPDCSHIIRDDDSFIRIRQYVVHNPLQWELDRYHPARTGEGEGDDWLDVLGDKT